MSYTSKHVFHEVKRIIFLSVCQPTCSYQQHWRLDTLHESCYRLPNSFLTFVFRRAERNEKQYHTNHSCWKGEKQPL